GTARARTAGAVQGRRAVTLRDHELDPQRLLIAVVRRAVGGAQRIETPLLHTLLGGRELGKLEDHERARVHLLQGKRQRLPSRLDPKLRAAADRGSAGVFEALAVALKDDRIGDGAGLEPAEVTGDSEAAH